MLGWWDIYFALGLKVTNPFDVRSLTKTSILKDITDNEYVIISILCQSFCLHWIIPKSALDILLYWLHTIEEFWRSRQFKLKYALFRFDQSNQNILFLGSQGLIYRVGRFNMRLGLTRVGINPHFGLNLG